jgi:hypothetical protein
MISFLEELDVNGHLTISKLKNGIETVVFDDHNIIVSGMGVGLAHLFAVSGSTSILDYQIDRFQIGTSGGTTLEVSSTNALSGSLTSLAQYGVNSNILCASAYQIKNNSIITTPVWYGLIPQQNITRIDSNTVRYTIILDDEACNSKTLNEIGIFIKNIKGNSPVAPILVAYRHFDDIDKSSDFSLIFRWSINW